MHISVIERVRCPPDPLLRAKFGIPQRAAAAGGGGVGSLDIVGLLYVFYVRRRHSKCVEWHYSNDTSVPHRLSIFLFHEKTGPDTVNTSFVRKDKVWPRFCIHISRLTLFGVQVPSPCSVSPKS